MKNNITESKDKIHIRLHLQYFILKMILVATVFFIAFQAIAMLMLKQESIENTGFAEHTYCGTFFITVDKDNSFISESAYNEYLELKENFAVSTENIVMVVLTVAIIIMMFAAFRSADKNKLLSGKNSRLFIFSGVAWLSGNIFVEVKGYFNIMKESSLYKGVLSTASYYCPLYKIAAIPILLIILGLVLRQYELTLSGTNACKNSRVLKGTAITIMTASYSFILYRFIVRSYELIATAFNKSITVKLPFYSRLLDLPPELADTAGDYKKLIALRLIKDLPVFAAFGITVLLLCCLLFSASEKSINTTLNKRRLYISIIALLISSVLFNIFGIFEAKMLNDNFNGIYETAVYTIGIRSNCEPCLYALVLWIFSNFIQAVPEINCNDKQ